MPRLSPLAAFAGKLSAVEKALDALNDSIPDSREHLLHKAETYASHEWRWLVHNAHLALVELNQRGRFSEDEEEAFS